MSSAAHFGPVGNVPTYGCVEAPCAEPARIAKSVSALTRTVTIAWIPVERRLLDFASVTWSLLVSGLVTVITSAVPRGCMTAVLPLVMLPLPHALASALHKA